MPGMLKLCLPLLKITHICQNYNLLYLIFCGPSSSGNNSLTENSTMTAPSCRCNKLVNT